MILFCFTYIGVRFTHNTFSESETLKSLIPTAELMKYSLSLSEVQQITPLGFSSKEELLEMDEQKVLDIVLAFLKKTAPPEMEVDEITEALEAVFEKTFPYNVSKFFLDFFLLKRAVSTPMSKIFARS